MTSQNTTSTDLQAYFFEFHNVTVEIDVTGEGRIYTHSDRLKLSQAEVFELFMFFKLPGAAELIERQHAKQQRQIWAGIQKLDQDLADRKAESTQLALATAEAAGATLAELTTMAEGLTQPLDDDRAARLAEYVIAGQFPRPVPETEESYTRTVIAQAEATIKHHELTGNTDRADFWRRELACYQRTLAEVLAEEEARQQEAANAADRAAMAAYNAEKARADQPAAE